LSQFPVHMGRDLLIAYLKYQRPTRAPYDSYPFSLEGLDKIAEISAQESRGAADVVEPRSLIQAAWEVTSKALMLDSVQVPLDSSFVEHVLKGTPLPIVQVEDEFSDPDSERWLGQAVICPCTCHNGNGEAPVYDVFERIAGTTHAVAGHFCAACSLPLTVIESVRV
jgi:hypothetical protein